MPPSASLFTSSLFFAELLRGTRDFGPETGVPGPDWFPRFGRIRKLELHGDMAFTDDDIATCDAKHDLKIPRSAQKLESYDILSGPQNQQVACQMLCSFRRL